MEFLHLNKDPSKPVHCPYNVSHTMPSKTMVMHLIKCPNRPPNYVHCSLNYLHVMPKSEQMDHELNCPNRSIIDRALYESEDVVRPKIEVQTPTVNDNDESWDEPQQTNSTSYRQVLNQRSNFMKPEYGLTKSERKKHRSQMSNLYRNVDLSYNAVNSINQRQDASTIGPNKNIKKSDGKNFFIGTMPPK